MAFLLKINAARRLSGSEGRRPALSFSSYGEAFKASREIFGYLAEHTTRAAGIGYPYFSITYDDGTPIFSGHLESARLPRCGVEHFYIAGHNALDGRSYRQCLTCKECR